MNSRFGAAVVSDGAKIRTTAKRFRSTATPIKLVLSKRDPTNRFRRRRTLGSRSIWISAIVTAVVLIAVNLPTATVNWTPGGRLDLLPGQFESIPPATPLPVVAGWPKRCYWRYADPMSVTDDAASPPAVTFDRSAAIVNLGVAVAIVVAAASFCGLLKRRGQKSATLDADDPRASGPSRRIRRLPRLTIADLIIASVLVALPMGVYQFHRSAARRERRLVERIEPASFVRETVVPVWLDHLVPPSLRGDWCTGDLGRITRIDLRRPDDDAVAAAMTLSRLRELRIGGGDYRLSHLRSLNDCRYLTSMHLTGRAIDDATAGVIATMPNLRCINLHRTNVTAEAVDRMFPADAARTARIGQLNLVDTAVDLTELDRRDVLSRFAAMVKLELPRPINGTQTIRVDGLSRLRAIGFYSLDRPSNPDPIKIRLEDLTQTSSFRVDALQPVSLDIRRTPKLMTLGQHHFAIEPRVDDQEAVPQNLDCRQLMIQDARELRRIKLFAPRLEAFRTIGTPKLWDVTLAADATYKSSYGMWGGLGFGSEASDRQFNDQQERMIGVLDGLAKSDGPESIDLTGFQYGYRVYGAGRAARTEPLTPAMIDLNRRVAEAVAGLGDNGRLVSLRVPDHLPSAAILALGKIRTLRHINFRGGMRDMAWCYGELCEQLPDLQSISGVSAGSISHRPIGPSRSLRSIGEPEPTPDGGKRSWFYFHGENHPSLVLRSLPRLDSAIRIMIGKNSSLHLNDLPKLSALVIDRPLSPNDRIDGLDGLGALSVGGAAVDDAMIGGIGAGKRIERLALIRTSTTADGLANWLDDQPVKKLHLTGVAVGGDMLRGVDRSNLQTLSILDVNVPSELVDAATMYRELRVLEMPHADADDQAALRIAMMPKLESLALDGSNLSDAALAEVFSSKSLSNCLIRGIRVNDAVADALTGSSIELLTLVDCEVDPVAISSLVKQNQTMRFRMWRTQIPAIAESVLLGVRRLQMDSADQSSYSPTPGGWVRDARYAGPRVIRVVATQTRFSVGNNQTFCGFTPEAHLTDAERLDALHRLDENGFPGRSDDAIR